MKRRLETASTALRTDVVSDEAADGEGVTEFLAFGSEKLLDGKIRVFHEGLVDETGFGEELVDLTDEDLFNDLGRFASGFELLAVDVVFFLDGGRVDVVAS